MRVLRIVFFALVFLYAAAASAQKTNVYIDPDLEFKTGVELFDKKLYTAAQKSFLNVMATAKNPKSMVRIDAEFYAAACAIELFHKDGEWRFRQFINNHPESNKVKWAFFYLGKSNFRKKKYDEVIKWLEQVDVYDLNGEDLAELYFKRGYSYYETGNLSKAKADFFEIKDADNKYMHPANYYYSHIAYLEKNYETAAEGFRKLLNNETFGPIIPYYVAQIYFMQAKYDSVIKLAPALLNDTAKVLKQAEINKIIGESYYRKQQYDKALPYLKNYGGITQGDNYEIGYILYRSGKKAEALSYFENATTGNDTIAQSAWYHLADCQLSIDEKTKARNSFYSAYKTGKNESIKEDALYSFAKLSYELSLTPYNEAITAFSDYINNYPKSPRREEAFRFLVNVFASTQNYLEAMKAIQKIKNPEPSLNGVYQRMAWNLGVDFFNKNETDSAQRYFDIASKNNYDPRITAQCMFWSGEIVYRKGQNASAVEVFKEFLGMTGAVSLREYELAKYNAGYCYFNMKDYKNARIWYSQYTGNTKQNDKEKMADALIRYADCNFMLKQWDGAAENYETAIAIGKKEIDYCLYQKSLCDGFMKRYEEKIAGLKRLANEYPNSGYVSGSYLEIAEAHIRSGEQNYPNAIDYYNKYLQKYPNTTKKDAVNAQIGVLYYKLKDYNQALDYFYALLNKDPRSPESTTTAWPNVKNILLAQGKPDEVQVMADKYGFSVDKNEIEEATFDKIADYYVLKKDCDKSMPECEKYLSKFPNGNHLLDVNFWYAECAYSKGEYNKALPGYKYVLGRSDGSYTERATTKAAFIYFKNNEYEEALSLYKKLQSMGDDPVAKFNAKVNAMRCAWKAKKYEDAAEQAALVLQSQKAKGEQIYEARNVRAHSLYESGKLNESMEDWVYVSKNAESVEGAEAYYHIAAIHLNNKKYRDLEKTIDKLMSYKYADKYWMTKGLLLMADGYTEQKKYSDAEALLQTIIDNQVDEALKEEARKKLEAIRQLQNMRMVNPNQNQSDTMKVKFNGSPDLFDEMYNNLQNNNNGGNKPAEGPK